MILLVDNQTSFLDDFKLIFKSLGQELRVVPQDDIFTDIQRYNYIGVVLSGGPKPNLTEEFKFDMMKANVACLVNYNLPVLGICEGFEILCDCCGGVVKTMSEPSIYNELPIKIEAECELFEGLPEVFPAYEHHSDGVFEVPPQLRVVASSSRNRIEAVAHQWRPFFGTQFHPEKSGEYGKRIFSNFVDLCRKRAGV